MCFTLAIEFSPLQDLDLAGVDQPSEWEFSQKAHFFAVPGLSFPCFSAQKLQRICAFESSGIGIFLIQPVKAWFES
jgi:hypothetical protein